VAAHAAKMDTRKALTSDSMCAASDMMATLHTGVTAACQWKGVGLGVGDMWKGGDTPCCSCLPTYSLGVGVGGIRGANWQLRVPGNLHDEAVNTAGIAWNLPFCNVSSHNLNDHEDEAQHTCNHQLPLDLHTTYSRW
jgi:hypothetical protein